MHVTVHDVARHAKVSISTVSRVLNGSARVTADKKSRVLDAVRALGYIPNPAARDLVRRKTGTIGALLPHISGEFFAKILAGLDSAAQDHNRLLVVSASHRHASQFSEALRGLQRRVDGLLIMAPELKAEEVLAMTGPGIPTVFLNTRSKAPNIHAFNFDNYGGMNAMTRHVVDAGHEHIAFVMGPEEAHDAQERLMGFRHALTPGTHAVEVAGDFSSERGHDAAVNILRTAPQTTAIIASNDLSALGVLRALLERGIDVPGEMIVTGFDDISSARFAMPSLTSVHVPIRQLTREAVCHLVSLITGQAAPKRHMEQLELSLRESTGGIVEHKRLKTFS